MNSNMVACVSFGRSKNSLAHISQNFLNFFTIDTDGKKYIIQVKDEGDKNHSIKDLECSNQAQIYGIDSYICPVVMFELYM